jgi:hypothetical protein
MTEVLTARQLSFLQRAAAAGHVSVATVDEKKTFDELVAKKLIFGNQLTDAGWMELRKTRPGSLEGLIPFAPSPRKGR